MSTEENRDRAGMRGWLRRNWRWILGALLPLMAYHNLLRYWKYDAAGNSGMATLTLAYTISLAIFAIAWPLLVYCELRLRARRLK